VRKGLPRLCGLLLAFLALGALAPVSAVAVEAQPDPFGEFTPIMVVLDTSGSMEKVIDEVASGGGRRLDAAQAAILDLIAALPQGQPYGMVAYPGRDSTNLGGCSIGRVETSLGGLDVSAASAAVRRMTPDGNTPTGPALQHASDLIRDAYGDAVGGVIVLVSDGESNCGSDPCEVAKSIRAAGVEVQVNTVGLQIEGRGEQELRCISEATGGRYISADDPDDLADAIGAAAQARISVTVAAPPGVFVIAGTGESGGGEIGLIVRSTGRVAAADVRVALSVSFTDGPVGSVLVPRPVRFLGNVDSGNQIALSFIVRPDDHRVGAAQWSVSVTARNAAPQVVTGEFFVRDTLGRGELGTLLNGVSRVAVVGDSYSSGEGAGGFYREGTNGGKGESACHRSDSTYAARIWGNDSV
jgi:hypothetical protein